MPTCRIRGCGHGRRGHQLLCTRCWRAVPEPVRADVLAHHKPGSVRQSAEYFAAVAEAIRAAQASLTAGRAASAPTTTSEGGN